MYLQVRSICLKYQRMTNPTSKLPAFYTGYICLVICCPKYTIYELIFRIIEFVPVNLYIYHSLLCNKNNFGEGQHALFDVMFQGIIPK